MPTLTAGRQATANGSRWRALPWLFCFQFFVVEQVARAHVRGPYSMARDTISDLGAVHCFAAGAQEVTSCSALHHWMDASFTLQGLLILLGASLVRRLLPTSRFVDAALVLFFLSGAGLIVVGVLPEDVGGALHVTGAIAHFVCGSLAMLLIGVALIRQTPRERWAGVATLAAGVVAFGATFLLAFRHAAFLHLHVGAIERCAAYPLPLWLTLAGVALLFRVRPSMK